MEKKEILSSILPSRLSHHERVGRAAAAENPNPKAGITKYHISKLELEGSHHERCYHCERRLGSEEG